MDRLRSLSLLLLLLLGAAAALLLPRLASPPAPPGQSLAADIVKTRQALQSENHRRLETYAWTDKAHGKVQIPIERAMQLTIEELNLHTPARWGEKQVPPP